MASYLQLCACDPVEENDITSLHTWHENYKNAIVPEEKEYLDHGDLFPVRKQQQVSPLLRFLDTKESFRHLKLWEVGKPKAGLPLPVSQDIRYYSSERKEWAGAWLFSILGLLMIVGPAWGLAYIPSKAGRLGLSSCSAILFFGLVGIASTAKPQEALAAAAT